MKGTTKPRSIQGVEVIPAPHACLTSSGLYFQMGPANLGVLMEF